jgi:protein SCO1/2
VPQAALIVRASFALVLVLAACRPGEPLPSIAPVPALAMQDQDGKPFTEAELKGRVAIVSFMFTSCPDVCPILTNKLSGLRTQLLPQREQVRFVSISVDPEKDTPPVLKEFARKHGADYPDWRFLTGPIAKLRDVVVQGFKQSLDRGDGSPHGIMHGSHFVLVDRAGMIRGFYRSDQEGVLLIARDARRLIAGKE